MPGAQEFPRLLATHNGDFDVSRDPGDYTRPYPATPRPYDILRAHDLVLVHPDIPAKLRLTMQVLVAHINRFNPCAEILVDVSTIAEEIDRDRKTVCRHLYELEVLG